MKKDLERFVYYLRISAEVQVIEMVSILCTVPRHNLTQTSVFLCISAVFMSTPFDVGLRLSNLAQ